MAIPNAPTNLNVQTGQGNNFVSWDQMLSPLATSYVVQRSQDQITYATVATLSGSPLANFYSDAAYDSVLNPTGVRSGIQYWYQVSAVNGSGSSANTISSGIIPAPIGQVSLSWVRLMAFLRADMLHSQFISLPEANSYISNSYKALYDILAQKFGDEYFSSSTYTWTTQQNLQLYPLPPDFYKSTLVEVSLNPADPTAWVTLKRFNKIQQNLLNFPNVYTYWGFTNLRYRFTGNFLEIVPVTIGNQTLRMWYTPRSKILLQDTDILDGISGWEDYVVLDAARKMMLKQEQDTSEVVNEMAMIIARIESAAENRDVAEPDTVSDSRRRNFGWGGDGDGGFNGSGGYS